MKKIIALAAFSLQIFMTNSVPANDLYIKMDIFQGRQEKIYKEVVVESGLHKKSRDNYHLTLAQVEGEKNNDDLRKYLVEELNKASKKDMNKDHAIQLGDVQPGRYTVNRNLNNCPIVLFPDQQTTTVLKGYNLALNNALAEFNKKNKTTYKMGKDVQPNMYTPHITLADTNWINTKCTDSKDKKFPDTRDFMIDKLQRNIDRCDQVKKQGHYDFMLAVPTKQWDLL